MVPSSSWSLGVRRQRRPSTAHSRSARQRPPAPSLAPPCRASALRPAGGSLDSLGNLLCQRPARRHPPHLPELGRAPLQVPGCPGPKARRNTGHHQPSHPTGAPWTEAHTHG